MPQTEVGRSEDLLAELAGWVKLETPTTDPASVNRLMDVAEGELGRAGAELTRIPGRGGFGDNLIARTTGEGKPILVAGHLDTVWSLGTHRHHALSRRWRAGARAGHLRHEGGQLPRFSRGARHPAPEGADAGARSCCCSPRTRRWAAPPRRDVIEREAAQAAYALIPEPAGAGGAA